MANVDTIANAIMGYLYSVVGQSTGSLTAPAPDHFISWCMPGLPFRPEEFKFAQEIADGDTSNTVTDKAALFSIFANFIPDVSGLSSTAGVLKDTQAGIGSFNNTRLDTLYPDIIKQMQCAVVAEPPEFAQKRADIIARMIPLKKSYDEYAELFQSARTAFLLLRNARSQADKDRFHAEGGALLNRARRAEQDWRTLGHKDEYEALQQQLDNLSIAAPTAFRDAQEALIGQAMTHSLLGEFRLAVPFPTRFAEGTQGWQRTKLSMSDVANMSSLKNSKYSAGGGARFGFFRAKAEAGGNSHTEVTTADTSEFELEMLVTQVPILRPWFNQSLLENRLWRFKDTAPQFKDKVLSDGANPPHGLLIAYPASAIFVRDVKIRMKEFRSSDSEITKAFHASGGGGYIGVINLGGDYSRDQTTKTHVHHLQDGELSVDGMQLVGFRCELIKHAPDPQGGLSF